MGNRVERWPSPPFPVAEALDRIAALAATLPPPAMFRLADEGRHSVFEQVVACLVSVRTRDETTIPAVRRLFAAAPDPAAVSDLRPDRIERLIAGSTFADRKAGQILAIARAAVERFGGILPCDDAVLRSFDGVGPKCANLALGVACHLPRISVDVHVHRVVNRWGAVRTKTPEQTLTALEAIVPPERWISINRWLMPFGKYWCTAVRPRCSDCPVRDLCHRVGVTSSR